MNTPIVEFVNSYIGENNARFHMPGHKGISGLGFEPWDITEIPGADSLFEADGIIKESEQNAGTLFGANTFYSTEGSSHAIRAMLSLVCQYAAKRHRKPLVWAARNVHSSFVSATALLDFSIQWLYPSGKESYLSCSVDAEELKDKLKTANTLPTAVYITSPDYLGNCADIAALSAVCHLFGVLLIVDNAHGAYLKFLPTDLHPIASGADMCCDSAHKTLPVITGGAYMHLSRTLTDFTEEEVREALRLFGSTSPSYLILQSLDSANRYLDSDFSELLSAFLPKIEHLKKRLTDLGYILIGSEPLKITVAPKSYGYTGTELATLLSERQIIAEFADPDYVVFMLSPIMESHTLDKLADVLTEIPRKSAIMGAPPRFVKTKTVIPVREATMRPFISLPIEQCVGHVLARASVSCPPAVPILVSGEMIDKAVIECFRYYGIDRCCVVKE